MDHPAFASAGQKEGLEEWRIENLEPVPVSKAEYGKFYTGDSYIILNTVGVKNHFLHNLHFWLGKETSQDESCAAALLAVALDDHLGGGPVQYREVQGHESKLFLEYYKSGIRYLDGGHASGFNHVTTNGGGQKCMFQVKGKKNVRVKQVAPDVSSMNNGDCFILDVENTIYVYVGPKAQGAEKMKAISAANQIRDQDHGGRSKVDIIDEFSSMTDYEDFFTALGSGSKDTVPDESSGVDDRAFEKSDEDAVSLYKITDASGKMETIKVAQKPFKQDQLDENDCFILDTTTGGIYAWVGKKCTKNERSAVMSKALEFMKTKNYPSWVHVTKVPQGAEPGCFKQHFSTWES